MKTEGLVESGMNKKNQNGQIEVDEAEGIESSKQKPKEQTIENGTGQEKKVLILLLIY